MIIPKFEIYSQKPEKWGNNAHALMLNVGIIPHGVSYEESDSKKIFLLTGIRPVPVHSAYYNGNVFKEERHVIMINTVDPWYWFLYVVTKERFEQGRL